MNWEVLFYLMFKKKTRKSSRKRGAIDKAIIVKRGWMFIYDIHCTWKLHLFSLTSSGELRFYLTTKDSNPVGLIFVFRVQRMKISGEYPGKKYVLELFTNEKKWSLAVQEQEEAHQWMFAIQLVQEKQILDFNDLLEVQDAIGTIQVHEDPPAPIASNTTALDLFSSPIGVETKNEGTSNLFDLSTTQRSNRPNIALIPVSDLLMPTSAPIEPEPLAIKPTLPVVEEKKPELPFASLSVPKDKITQTEVGIEAKRDDEREMEVQMQIETQLPDLIPEMPVNEEENIENDIPSPRSLQRSLSTTFLDQNKEGEEEEEGENEEEGLSHSTSDSMLTPPSRFVPHTIQTNWSSYRVRTMQMETLKNWVNFIISPHGVQIEDIGTAFSTGEILCILVESITGTEIGYNEEPAHVAFMHQNVNFALGELRKHFPEFQGAATHEIISGKLSSIIEMIWNIIDVTEISSVSYNDVVGQEALLQWVQNQVKSYEILVPDFDKSFSDGRIFCALANVLDPQKLDYYTYNTRRKDILQMALEIGKEEGIPLFFTADTFLDKMDPVSVIVYLYQWYSRMGV